MVNPAARRTAAYAIVFLLLFLSIGMVSASHPGAPGGGNTDGWVDVHGDRMYGDLVMGTNDIVLNNRHLESPFSNWLRWDGQRVCIAHQSISGCGGSDWSLAGNSGTNPSTNFIGTNDDVPLVLKVDGRRVGRFDPAISPCPTETRCGPNVLFGYEGNSIDAGVQGATISGGGGALGSTVAAPNSISRDSGTIGGGHGNSVSGFSSTIGGGQFNAAGSSQSGAATVGGGALNWASGAVSTIAGGSRNLATDSGAAVGGGNDNFASGWRSTVPGGSSNEAAGDISFAAGNRAHADHHGAFVWADSTNADFRSSRADQWSVRAAGGVSLFTNPAATTGCKLNPGSGSWSCSSDRDLKENWREVDGREVLDRLIDVPIATWNYKSQDPKVQHMGPAAQDMYAAFGLGVDETGISQVDGDGVAFAAIQGLWLELQEERARNDELEARILALETSLGDGPGSG